MLCCFSYHIIRWVKEEQDRLSIHYAKHPVKNTKHKSKRKFTMSVKKAAKEETTVPMVKKPKLVTAPFT